MVAIFGKITYFVLIVCLALLAPLFRLFPALIRRLVFQPSALVPKDADYKHPEKYGFVGGRNFMVTTPDGASIGVWHILPSNLEEKAKSLVNTDDAAVEQTYKEWLADATVFLYVHGSTGSRVLSNRLVLYKLLKELNYHVITFDYRGYGDSSSTPTTETHLVQDTQAVFAWVRERVTSGKLYIWGHSLGTGVVAHASAELVGKGENIKGIVLESAYNNMADTFRAQPLLAAAAYLPWFEFCFIQPLYKNDLSFESDKYLPKISTPLLMLHAKDDKNVPYRLAVKLQETVAASRQDPNSVQLVSFEASLGYGHFNIPSDPNLGTTIRQFVGKTNR